MYGHKFESHARAYKSLDVYAFSIIDMCHKNVIGIYKHCAVIMPQHYSQNASGLELEHILKSFTCIF